MITATDGKKRTQGPGRLCQVLMVATLLSPSIATAAESVLPAGSFESAGSFISVIVSLAGVLALILLVGWFMNRLQRVRRGGSATLEVVDVLPVGPKEKILLIRAGEKQVLLGMAPGRISALAEFEPEAAKPKPKFSIAEHAA
ncbi:MAG: flagellar biosynthetic protein FliO [Gammaproteobacteria bacterium]|nr:flagellar biosynthetic protein FliO [Gammaproteobacteria bacterium]NNF60048.1 flagellar biosynthetic protein FliO [Gammaproteobacteria bacterium]NNM19979.1 flagellar biosynthetic protein FliO [Gammaproteobacteria bacterium]